MTDGSKLPPKLLQQYTLYINCFICVSLEPAGMTTCTPYRFQLGTNIHQLKTTSFSTMNLPQAGDLMKLVSAMPTCQPLMFPEMMGKPGKSNHRWLETRPAPVPINQPIDQGSVALFAILGEAGGCSKHWEIGFLSWLMMAKNDGKLVVVKE